MTDSDICVMESEEDSDSQQSSSTISAVDYREPLKEDKGTNLFPFQCSPQYQEVLKKIKFSIETMPRSQLEQFCYSKIQSEIECKSSYEIQAKKIDQLSLELNKANELLEWYKNKKKITRDFGVQVSFMDMISPNSESSESASNISKPQYTATIKVRDISTLKKSPIKVTPIFKVNTVPKAIQLSQQTIKNKLNEQTPTIITEFHNQQQIPTTMADLPQNKLCYVYPQLNDFNITTDSHAQNNQNHISNFISLIPNFPIMPSSSTPNTQMQTNKFNTKTVPINPNHDHIYSKQVTYNHVQSNVKYVPIKPRNLQPNVQYIVVNSDNVPTSMLNSEENIDTAPVDVKPEIIPPSNSNVPDEKEDNSMDIEDTLPHALITLNNNPTAQPQDSSVNVFKVIKTVDLTEEKAVNSNKDTNSPDSDMPFIVSAVSLALNTEDDDIQSNDENLPVIVSTHSLAPDIIANTCHNPMSNLHKPAEESIEHSKRIAKILNKDKTFTNEHDENLSVPLSAEAENKNKDSVHKQVIRKVNFGIIRPENITAIRSSPSQKDSACETSSEQTLATLSKLLSTEPISTSTSQPIVQSAPQSHHLDDVEIISVTCSNPLSEECSERSTSLSEGKTSKISKDLTPQLNPIVEKDPLEENNTILIDDLTEDTCDDVLKDLSNKIIHAFQKSYSDGSLIKGMSVRVDINGVIKIITLNNINMRHMGSILDRSHDKHFFKFFASAIIRKIKESVKANTKGKILIKKCDLLEDTIVAEKTPIISKPNIITIDL